jgi:phosphoribosylanthranilate isomerase
MTRVKICGITNLEDALVAQKAGADFLGFIFAESPRRVSVKTANIIIKKISPKVKIVALFVNETEENVKGAIAKLKRVDILQFHGDETPEYCSRFKGRKVIKAIRVKNKSSLKAIKEYKGVDYILLDTYSKTTYGGTGKTFNWELAKEAKRYGIPIFLSGGLNPDNVKEAIKKVKPFAVDVSSGVEISPGKKDPKLIRNVFAARVSLPAGRQVCLKDVPKTRRPRDVEFF